MGLILDIDMEKQTRLKNKVNLNFKKSKKKNIKKKIALFDLDETLVHCTGDIKITKEKYQHVIEVKLPGKQTIQVGINIRPYWKQTFNLIKKNYYIVIYTASHHAYADAVLDFMDPKRKFSKYRLYRNNCSLINVNGAQFYVKDLDIFNEHYNLKDIIIIDNSVLSFAYHLHNGIPIVPYYDEDKDGSLYVVGLYLKHIFNEEDLREANKKYINLDSFLEEAKKRKEEEENEPYDDDSTEDIININDEIKKNNTDNKNKNEKKPVNNNIIDIRNSIIRFSEKRISFDIMKKPSITQYSAKALRKRSDFSEKENNRLKSKSKLLTMYYEVNDDSPKSASFIKRNETFDQLKRNKEKSKTNIIIEEKNEKTKSSSFFICQNKNNEEMDCKSEHPCELNLPDDDINKEGPGLVRGFTIRDDFKEDMKNKIKYLNSGNNHKYKLNFIRSNFYNTFKIK